MIRRLLPAIMCLPGLAALLSAQPLHELFSHLPPHVSVLTTWGARPEWGRDGTHLFFLGKSIGDVFRIDLRTREVRPVTDHFHHEGFNRIGALANGDLLLAGHRQFDAENPWQHRHDLEMWVLDKGFQSPAVSLGERCDEGPAVSRKNLTIAWTAPGQREIYVGEIVYSGGKPAIASKRLVVSYKDSPDPIRLETQDFRPPHERELLYTHYWGTHDEPFRYSDTYGINLDTGERRNYTNSPNTYDEAEGVFPSGAFTLIESDRHQAERMWKVDVYRLRLDGSGQVERLLDFSSRYPGVISDNPVVSPDGRSIAVQVGFPRMGSGQGRGILLFDVEKYERRKAQGNGE